jgi:hypothetical protein
MSQKTNAVDEMSRRVLEIVYPDGIFPNDYPKAVGIISMIALGAEAMLAKPAPAVSTTTSSAAGSRERERRRSEPDEGGAPEEPTPRRAAAWDRAVARSQIGQRRDTTQSGYERQPNGADLQSPDD